MIVAETSVGDVRGLEGFYHYRQYSAVELAEKRSLEDVWYLMFEGELPTAGRAGGLRWPRSGPTGSLPPTVAAQLPAIAAASERFLPLDGAAHGDLAGRRGRWSSTRRSTSPPRSCARNALQVCAVVPTTLIWRSTACSTASSRSTRTRTSATPPTTST